MTPEQILAIVGVVTSIAFEYVPGLNSWFNALEDTYQRLVMLGLMVLVVGVAYGLSCAGYLAYYACTEAGVWNALAGLVAAITANQATYLILPKRS